MQYNVVDGFGVPRLTRAWGERRGVGGAATTGYDRFMELPINSGALADIRVVDLSRVLAGPFCTMLLADYGAEVIKVEQPGSGDPTRAWGPPWVGDDAAAERQSAYYLTANRNKRGMTLDLKSTAGLAVARRLIATADVVVENFMPGTLARVGLDYDTLAAAHPDLVYCSITGYGQTGPYRDRPGFAVVAEAMGGLRHLSGEPGRVPVRCGVSLGDTLAALHGVIGVLLALQYRSRTVSPAAPKGVGQVVDVALYESVFNCMESLLPEYSAFGVVREPAGSALPGIAPSNAYRCADGHVLVAGNGDSIFKRLMQAIGRSDLAADPQLAGNTGRVARVAEIDAAIGDWTAPRTVAEVLDVLDAARVPGGRIYTVADIAADPHYRARGMLQEVTLEDGSRLTVPGIVPKLSRTPGGHRRNAPKLGHDTVEVLAELAAKPPRA